MVRYDIGPYEIGLIRFQMVRNNHVRNSTLRMYGGRSTFAIHYDNWPYKVRLIRCHKVRSNYIRNTTLPMYGGQEDKGGPGGVQEDRIRKQPRVARRNKAEVEKRPSSLGFCARSIIYCVGEQYFPAHDVGVPASPLVKTAQPHRVRSDGGDRVPFNVSVRRFGIVENAHGHAHAAC